MIKHYHPSALRSNPHELPFSYRMSENNMVVLFSKKNASVPSHKDASHVPKEFDHFPFSFILKIPTQKPFMFHYIKPKKNGLDMRAAPCTPVFHNHHFRSVIIIPLPSTPPHDHLRPASPSTAALAAWFRPRDQPRDSRPGYERYILAVKLWRQWLGELLFSNHDRTQLDGWSIRARLLVRYRERSRSRRRCLRRGRRCFQKRRGKVAVLVVVGHLSGALSRGRFGGRLWLWGCWVAGLGEGLLFRGLWGYCGFLWASGGRGRVGHGIPVSMLWLACLKSEAPSVVARYWDGEGLVG